MISSLSRNSKFQNNSGVIYSEEIHEEKILWFRYQYSAKKFVSYLMSWLSNCNISYRTNMFYCLINNQIFFKLLQLIIVLLRGNSYKDLWSYECLHCSLCSSVRNWMAWFTVLNITRCPTLTIKIVCHLFCPLINPSCQFNLSYPATKHSKLSSKLRWKYSEKIYWSC